MLDGRSLCIILSSRPALSEYVDGECWQKLDGLDWGRLLSNQPQFAEFCDWRKLSGENWGLLLGHQPQLEEHLDWASLDDWGWGKLLEIQPQYANRCEWGKLSETVRRFLLRVQPGITGYIKEPIDESDDESKIDWSGLGDAVEKEYHELLKKHGLEP